jgi:inner membrane protein involved in colicin E2 resistance
MEMATEPDIYTPNIDNNGNYIDKIPSFTNVKHGIRCPCGSRKDKIYETYTIFSQHIKTKAHQKWLQNLNLNKANYYIETEELKITVRQQQMIIAKLEKDLTNKSMTIDFLTQQLVLKNTKQTPIENLLDFD